jgi:hypothetical protein
VIASVGDERNALLMLTVDADLPGGRATLPAARLYLLDENNKIKAEQVIFYAAQDWPLCRSGRQLARLHGRDEGVGRAACRRAARSRRHRHQRHPARRRAAADRRPVHRDEKASGVQNTLQRFGAVFGVAIVAAVFSANGHLGSPATVISGFRPALAAAAALSVVGSLTALGADGRRRSPSVAQQQAPALAATRR